MYVLGMSSPRDPRAPTRGLLRQQRLRPLQIWVPDVRGLNSPPRLIANRPQSHQASGRQTTKPSSTLSLPIRRRPTKNLSPRRGEARSTSSRHEARPVPSSSFRTTGSTPPPRSPSAHHSDPRRGSPHHAPTEPSEQDGLDQSGRNPICKNRPGGVRTGGIRTRSSVSLA